MIETLLAAAVIAMAPQSPIDVYAYEVGDDNGDGVVMEDESGWNCTTMGNQVCGVGAVLPDGSPAVPGDYR